MGKVAKTVVLALLLGGLTFVVLGLGRDPRVAEPPGADTPDPSGVYDPVRAGERPPDGFRQLLRRDGIAPIYHPVHVPADDVDWADDTLVLGVAIDDEAVAYPIRVLNRREIVNDWIGDTPVFASW